MSATKHGGYGLRRPQTALRITAAILASWAVYTGLLRATAAEPWAAHLPEAAGVRAGIAVHLGCGEGRTAAQWGAVNPGLLVQGLDTDEAGIRRAKSQIDAQGLYGRVSAECYDGRNLPYADNLINLILLDNPAQVPANEVARVLVPHGVVYVPSGTAWRPPAGLKQVEQTDNWVKYEKPRPAEIDDWTHYLYGPSNNAVSADLKVGDPQRVQWFDRPEHSRDHDALASLSAMTSSGGRLFYIYDEGEVSVIHRPAHWKLVARDAFNGMLLWKRDIPTWMTHLYNFRGGPVQLPRRLVSVGDRVYVTLGLSAPVEELDAATGRTLRTFAGSEKTEEILVHNGMLLTVKGDPDILMDKADGCYGYWQMGETEAPTADKAIRTYDAQTGRLVWEAKGANLRGLVPLSLCAQGKDVFYLDHERLRCLDAQTGAERWAAPFPTEEWFIRSYAPTVVVADDVVLCLYWNHFCGFSVADGRQLWENKGSMGFSGPADLFVIDGKAWTFSLTKSIWRDSARDKHGRITTGIPIDRAELLGGGPKGTAFAVDIHTGQIVDQLSYLEDQHHHRCYRDKATQQYFLIGYSGIQLVDPKTKEGISEQWVRGICQYGIMPANGYIYKSPEPCQCYSDVKINGFFALGTARPQAETNDDPVLEHGPAFERAKALFGTGSANGWPTYRADAGRSGFTPDAVADSLAVRWKIPVGPSATAPVAAAGKVLVADRDGYAVYCLDAKTGTRLWKHLADGPVDSPPTIAGGLCLFGSGDGAVTSLDLERGDLVWRFRVAPVTHRVGAGQRLEAPLRIPGSVLVQTDTVYFAAGRSSHLDEGIRLYGLDVTTGRQKCETRLVSPPGQTPGVLADVLRFSEGALCLRNTRFDLSLQAERGASRFFSTNGLLDETWFHRGGWSIGGMMTQLAVDSPEAVYCAANRYRYDALKFVRAADPATYNQAGHLHQKYARYQQEEFFPIGTDLVCLAPAAKDVVTKNKTKNKNKPSAAAAWKQQDDMQVRALIGAADRLYAAGWVDSFPIELKTGRPKNARADETHAVLCTYSAKTGARLAQQPLEAPPIHDGLAAAGGRLYLSLQNGTLVCLGE